MTTRPPNEELDALRAQIAELEADLQRLREARTELARKHAFHQALIGGAPIGLGIADDAGEFILWNDAMLSVSGFSPGEEEAWKRARATAEACATRTRMMEVVKRQGGLFGHEFPIPQPDGSTGFAVATVKPIEVAGEQFVHVTMQDVTKHKRLEGALRESELRFRQVAETVRQVFYITTPDHDEVLYVSPAYATQWGRTCESLYAQPRSWIDAIHEEDRARVFGEVAAGSVEGAYEIEYRIVRPDGSVRWILDRAYELRSAEGRTYRLVGVAEDVTDRRRLQEQLREAQKMEAIGQLAGGVAHDFNNLLTVILAHVTFLRKDMPSEDPRRRLLAEVECAASRASDLTRKLLGFSRRAALALQPMDLRVVVRETVALLRRTIDPRIKIVIDEPDSLGNVLADPAEMSQVLLNLCLNARDAMPDGGRLVVRTRASFVSDEHARDHIDARIGEAVCLTVEDSGKGITPEVGGRIFEPFFTTKEPGAGTGLGLAMVFGTVKQHRGWIEFTSEIGRGTRFDIYLPLHQGPAETAAVSAEVTPRTEAAETVLFVDDEPGIRSVAAAILRDQGYSVLLAEDGLAALDLFQRHRGSIDLVILDLRMPKLSGRDTLHAIWRLDPNARVLVTSGHSEDYQRVADAERVAGCLPKPWNADQLARAVRGALLGNDAPVP